VPERMKHGALPVVTIDGTALRDDLAAGIEEIVVDLSLHLPDMVEVRLRDEKHDVLKRIGVQIGSTLAVTATRIGDGTQTELIKADVTALESDCGPAGSRAILRGYDPSHRLSRGRRTASYNDVTDSDVVRQVARRADVEVSRVDETTTTHPHLAQVNVTDWEFLTARARETGYEVAVVAGALEWRRPTSQGTAPEPIGSVEDEPAPLQLSLGTNLRLFRPRMTAGAQVADVEVRAWDPQRKTAAVGRSSAQTVSASVAVTPADLAATFGRPRYVCVDRPLASQPEADATAAALAEALASVHAEAEGVATGDPRLVAGAAVSVGHAGWPHDGRYTLTSTRHIYDAAGYRTTFTVSGRHERSLLGLTSSGIGGSAPVAGVVTALVTAVDDPEDQGRVKLRFPWLADDYETWWVRLAQLGAGDQRGAVWLPEVNDEVLVAFEHGDTRRPYVIGSLYNGVDLPRLGDGLVDGSSGAVKRRGFVSKQGHRLVFLDDSAKSGVAIVSADDSLRIALKQSDTTISIAADGSVEITGSQQVSVKSDGAINIEAGTTLTLKGGSGVKVDGGPQVEVSGGLIKLN